MSGAAIVAKVDAALRQGARATGSDELVGLLRKKCDGIFTYQEVTCLTTEKKSFDAAQMVQRTHKRLLVSALGAKPVKGDHLAVGYTLKTKDEVKFWARVETVDDLRPSDTSLLYRVMLAE